MENLLKWIKKQGITIGEFATHAGISQPHMSMIMSGKRGFSKDIREKIYSATNGEIDPNRLLSGEYEEAVKKQRNSPLV